MATPYILVAVAVAFLAATGLRVVRHGAAGPQGRTWLLVSGIFLLVAMWLLVG